MSSTVWVNVLLAVPFVLGWIGIPLWMVIKRPETESDFSDAHAYLAATRPQPEQHLAESAERWVATTAAATALAA